MDTRSSIENPRGLVLPTGAWVVLLILVSYVLANYSRWTSKKGQLQLPPGPKPKPIIGNLLDMPPPNAKVDFWTAHRDLYGPVSSLTILGRHLIIINDSRLATDAMNLKSGKYAARVVSPMLGDLCGCHQSTVLSQPWGNLRPLRKMVYDQVGGSLALGKWKDDIDLEVNRYLLRLLKQPKDFFQHVRTEAGTIILRIVYDYTVEPEGRDTLIEMIRESVHQFSMAAKPGHWMVDVVPVLKYVPAWFPGAEFKRVANQYKRDIDVSTRAPYDYAKRRLRQEGDDYKSVVSQEIKKRGGLDNLSPEDDDMIRWGAFSMYFGGADTTVAVIQTFYLAIIKFPEAQRKAQAEIDAVIGRNRLPQANDRINLPYVEALLKEVIRWNPLSESVLPHLSTEDDTINGYHIPKGSIMISHIYGMYHDPSVHIDPSKFNPDRFMGDNPEPDPFAHIWGYGRRICPGQFLAMSNMWLMVSRTLAAFDVRAVKGKEPSGEYVGGLLRRPVPFDAEIRVRPGGYETILRDVEVGFPWPGRGDSHLL